MPDPALWLVDRVAGGIADADHSPGYWQGVMFILADNPDDEIALADRDYYRNLARAALAAMPQPVGCTHVTSRTYHQDAYVVELAALVDTHPDIAVMQVGSRFALVPVQTPQDDTRGPCPTHTALHPEETRHD